MFMFVNNYIQLSDIIYTSIKNLVSEIFIPLKNVFILCVFPKVPHLMLASSLVVRGEIFLKSEDLKAA